MLTMTPKDSMEEYLCSRAYQHQVPVSGTFELLPICNMNCRMCYVRMTSEEMKRQGRMLELEQWLRIGREAIDSGTLFLLLTGGEPLLYPQFGQLYTQLRKMGLILTINTNGTLIDEELVSILKSDPPRRVNISLYGTSDEVYADLCGNLRGYTQVMRGIKLLQEAGIQIKLNYTLTPQNQHEMAKINQLSDEIGIPISIPTYMFPPARKQGLARTDIFDRLTPKQAAGKQLEALYLNFHKDPDYLEGLQKVIDEIDGHDSIEPVIKEVPNGFLCTAGVSSFWVNWQGRLTACGMLQKPYVDLLEHDFSSGWDRIRQESSLVCTSNKCFHCKYRSICQTCAASALVETGSYSREPEYHCEFCEEYDRLLRAHIRETREDRSRLSSGGIKDEDE